MNIEHGKELLEWLYMERARQQKKSESSVPRTRGIAENQIKRLKRWTAFMQVALERLNNDPN